MKKILSIALAAMVSSSVAFGADSAAKLSKEMFEFKKEASKEYYKIQKGCDDIHAKIAQATKNLEPKKKDENYKEYRYQMRQNMAKLDRDDKFFAGICSMNMYKNNKRANMQNRSDRPGKFAPNYPNGIYNPDCPNGMYNPDCPMR